MVQFVVRYFCVIQFGVIDLIISVRQNNWPPLPKGFCYQPCFYLDISVEIPPHFQHIVRQLYYLWLCKFLLKALIILC